MQRSALWWWCVSVMAGCYFSPDTHSDPDHVEPSDASMDGGDASIIRGMDAMSFDARPALDAFVDAAEVDAGCHGDLECPSNTPQCKAGICLACDEAADCARFPATPACAPSGACVACTTDQKQLCMGAKVACDPLTNACVECVADADCPSESKAACRNDRTCGACGDDTECERFGKVCNAVSGLCVQCRPDSEEMDCRSDKSCNAATANCAGTACDPKQFTCTSKQRGSVNTCNACVSDSECTADNRCIAMTFGSGKQELGGFCLKRTSAGCPPTYFRPLSRASLSGANAESYCGIDEQVNSCAALGSFSKPCTEDANCGHGGRCETVNGSANLCTYACMFPADCSSAAPCGGVSSDPYCGG